TVSAWQKLCQLLSNEIKFPSNFLKGPYHLSCMFEPNIFNFHTCDVTNNHFPKHTTRMVNLKMFFLPSRPPLVSVHSGTLLKSTY
ncbi:hypothetical protein LDENG_00157280, partial [Lucifuga dentata]